MPKKIHKTHLGIVRCKSRAAQIEEIVPACRVCEVHSRANPKEPLVPVEFQDRPWVKVWADIFQLTNHHNLIMADCFSKWLTYASMIICQPRTSSPLSKVRSPDTEFYINDHRQRTSGCFCCICSVHDRP